MRKYFTNLLTATSLTGFLFSSNQLIAQWSTLNGNLYVNPPAKVGIGLSNPNRNLDIHSTSDTYLRVSSLGGASLGSLKASIELRRTANNGTTNTWSINNENHFRIRHDGDLIFGLAPDIARLGINVDNPVEFIIYGKNVTKSGNSVVDGALRLHSKVGDNIHMLALDGNQIESSDPLYINNDSEQNVHLANGGGKVKVGTTDNEARFSIASESEMQLKLINPGIDGAAWRIGVANSNWSAGAGKLVFSKTSSSDDATMVITPAGNVGIGLTTPSKTLQVNGTTSTKILEITGGSDLAEHFDIEAGETLLPGTVVSIDPNKPGSYGWPAKPMTKRWLVL